MATPSFSNSTTAVTKWDEELVFSALLGQARRKLLVELATGGPQTGADLRHAGRGRGRCKHRLNFLDSTVKNLKVMVDAGIVVPLENTRDGRRPLYALAPGLKVMTGIGETVFDFGFCVVRLSADGN